MSDNVPVNIKDHIDKWVLEVTQGVVQTGPFTGMKILPEIIWGANSLGPMLLGCFEEELHPDLEREIERLALLPDPKVVNVGCSEGYYAIGLARRLPQATVWAVDISDDALRVAGEAAAANGVQLVVGDNLDSFFAAPDLIVMDCEGAEVEYLAPDRFPALCNATIIVEIHDWPGGPKVGEIVSNRFKATHTVKHIIEGARNPNKYPCLTTQTSMIRWAAVCEYRPCLMGWFVMRPK